jgi:hypothetical protein
MNPTSTPRLLRVLLVCLGLGSVAACVLLLAFLFCYVKPRIPPDTLPPVRFVVVVVDRTGSMGTAASRGVQLVREGVLERLGPGDFVDCLQVGSERGRFDEQRNRIFIDHDRLPTASAATRRSVSAGDICGSPWCDANRPWRERLDAENDRLRGLRETWMSRFDQVPRPVDSRYSEYLEVFRTVEHNAAGIKGERWLVVLGDLIQEGANLPAVDRPVESPLAGFHVVLVRPEGTHARRQAEDAEAYWTRYFAQRGARVETATFEHFGGIPTNSTAQVLASVRERRTPGSK